MLCSNLKDEVTLLNNIAKKFKSIEGIGKLLVNEIEKIISNTIKRERNRHPQMDIENILKEITDVDKQMLNIAYLEKRTNKFD